MKQILKQFEKAGIRYVVLRKSKDLDVSVHKEDWQKMDEIFRTNGYIQSLRNFNKNHICYKNEKYSFDVRHLENWNGIYFVDEGIYYTSIKKGGIYYPHSVYNLAHYIGHCTLGKRRFKDEYKKEIQRLFKKQMALKYLVNQLSLAVGFLPAVSLTAKLKKGRFPNPYPYVFTAILLHPFIFLKSFISWIIWKLKPYPVIAIIGCDGSGKSTAVKNLTKQLQKYRLPVEFLYMGRGRSNVVPMHKIGSKIKKRRIYHYYIYSLLSFIDLLLRYRRLEKIRKKKIVVLDRSWLDIMTMKRIPMLLKRFYLLFFDKPNYVFYLWNSVNELHKRRPEHPVQDLKRQIKLLDKLDSTKIKSVSESQVLKDIKKHLFC